ncbi:MAG: TetR/AcrR family transcriptional regulator [Proteobacteria bacterium]|nr:TetR/AcrR family transcriptional regulator [Pseudomonadota bacterium]
MTQAPLTTRELIIAAAVDLFYGEGVRGVSMDAIAARAGVTKRTLYYHFVSKDELVAAYLAARDQPTLATFMRWLDETEGGLSEKIEGMFQRVARAAGHPKWKGCGFLRTAAELVNTPGHPALKAGALHKKRFEEWLTSLIAADGLDDAPLRARQILVLLDGAMSVIMVHRDPAYAEAAGQAAAAIVKSKA